MTSQSNSPTPDHQPRPWIDLLVSIIIPSVILMKFSGDEHLGMFFEVHQPIGHGEIGHVERLGAALERACAAIES